MKLNNKYSDKIFYKYNDEAITYKDLFNKAKKLKIKKYSKVIILGNNNINTVISIIACILNKCTYIPVNNNIRLDDIIKESNATYLIDTKNLSINQINDYNKSKYVYMIFTSGTTGIPKGVPISNKNINNFIKWILKVIPKYNNVKVLNHASFSFDLSVASFYYTLFREGTLINVDSSYEDISKNIDIIKKEEIDVIVCTPTFIKLLLIDSNFNSNNLKSLKCIYFCGEVLDKKIVEKLYTRFNNLNVINAYGPTEATSAVSSISITKDMLNYDTLPIGNMKNNATKIKIIDNEIVLSGKSVFEGYINSNKVKYYKTGDIGYIKDDLLFYSGRLDNQIKYKGYRIELEDIENNIKKIKEVEDVVVIPIYDNNIIKYLKAFVVLSKPIDIKIELNKYLLDYMIPRDIEIVESIPITINLKKDRRAMYDRCK